MGMDDAGRKVFLSLAHYVQPLIVTGRSAFQKTPMIPRTFLFIDC